MGIWIAATVETGIENGWDRSGFAKKRIVTIILTIVIVMII